MFDRKGIDRKLCVLLVVFLSVVELDLIEEAMNDAAQQCVGHQLLLLLHQDEQDEEDDAGEDGEEKEDPRQN